MTIGEGFTNVTLSDVLRIFCHFSLSQPGVWSTMSEQSTMHDTPQLNKCRLTHMRSIDLINMPSAASSVPATGVTSAPSNDFISTSSHQPKIKIISSKKRHSLKKRLSRTDSTMTVLTTDPLTFPLTLPVDMRSRQDHNPSPPIKVEDHNDMKKTDRHLSFSGFVHNYITHIKRDSMHQDESTTCTNVNNSSSSCPNLIDEEDIMPIAKTKVRFTKSSEGYLGYRSPAGSSSNPSLEDPSSNRLTVPDMFTTSFTHSMPSTVDPDIGCDEQGQKTLRRSYRHSAPELMRAEQGPTLVKSQSKPGLMKSLSDTPEWHCNSQDFIMLDPPKIRPRSADDGQPRMAQILDYLFLGNIESAYSQRGLCKKGITSIVDLSNCPPEKLFSHKRSQVPCSCGRDTRHLKAFLRLNVSEDDASEIESDMEQINIFIEGAHKNDKKVLVHCYTGAGLSVVAIIQYLMRHRNMNLRKAYSMVMKHRTDIDIPQVFKDLLQKLEKDLIEPECQSLCFDSNSPEPSHLPMEAWTSTDSSEI